jgi:hypothetical protein
MQVEMVGGTVEECACVVEICGLSGDPQPQTINPEPQPYLTQRVLKVALHKSPPPQIRQLIFHYY